MKQNKSKFYSLLMTGLFVSSLGMPTVAEAGAGKLWPFASKKHIKQQIDPLTGRVSELEEVGRQHAARIKEIDERTQAGVREAMSKTEQADAKAIAAGEKAAEAEGSANRAYASVGDTEKRLSSRLENVENYQQVKTLDVSFKLNKTELDESGRVALDELASELKSSKGYVLEVQGFADPSGSKQVNLELSRLRAGSVVRYLAEKHEVPLFRMRTLGMGSANAVQDDNGRTSAQKSRRVEVHLLRNSITEMASK